MQWWNNRYPASERVSDVKQSSFPAGRYPMRTVARADTFRLFSFEMLPIER
jgi:hypothetical protein